jgi:hypothetical protein
MNNLPYIKRHYNFSSAIPEFDVLFNYLESLNSKLDGFDELQGPALTTAGIKNMNQPHTWPELAGFMDTIYSTSIELFGPISKEDFIKNIARSWANRYWEGSNITEHTHDGCDMVISAYVSKPPNSGNLELYYNGQWNEVEVNTNDVIVFAGCIPHRTQISQSKDPRVIISMNTNHYVRQYLEQIDRIKNPQKTAKLAKDYSDMFEQKLKEFVQCLCKLN